jgi:hypothetical protein
MQLGGARADKPLATDYRLESEDETGSHWFEASPMGWSRAEHRGVQ